MSSHSRLASRLVPGLAVLGAVAVLVLAANTVALAASGKGFLLGKVNKSAKVSTLQRTKSGPALSLKTKGGPPLAVNSAKLVKKLNADKVDGYDAGALVNGGTLFTITIPESAPVNSELDALPARPGRYQVTWSAHLSVEADTLARCGAGTLKKPAYSLTGTAAGASARTSSTTHEVMLSGTGPITVRPSDTLFFQCFNDDSYNMTTKFPVQVMITPIQTRPGTPNESLRKALPR